MLTSKVKFGMCSQVVVADEMVAASFQRDCYTYNPHNPSFQLPPHLAHLKNAELGSPEITAALRACVSDEHYIPTVLAANGLDDEVGTMTLMADVHVAMTAQ